MKTNHFLRLGALSLALLLFSCEQDLVVPGKISDPPVNDQPPPSDPPETPPTNQVPPPVTESSQLTQMGSQILKYDDQKRLVAVSYTDSPSQGYTVVYEGDKVVRLNYKTGGYMLYTYSGDKVVEAVRYYGENLVNYRYTFAYRGDKLEKETEMSYAMSDEGRLSITEYSYDANGNLVELRKPSSTSQHPAIKWGNYDAKPNPMPYANSQFYLPGIKLFNNNPGYRDPGGSGKVIYSYEYHEAGLPKQRSEKLESFPHAGPFVTSFQYE